MTRTRIYRSAMMVCLIASSVTAQQPSRVQPIKTGPETVEWGYFDASKKPVAVINSGEIVQLESPLAGSREMETFGLQHLITPEMRALEEGVAGSDKGPGANILVGP